MYVYHRREGKANENVEKVNCYDRGRWLLPLEKWPAEPACGAPLRLSGDRPTGNQIVNLAHEADGFVQGDGDLLVVVNLVGCKAGIIAIDGHPTPCPEASQRSGLLSV